MFSVFRNAWKIADLRKKLLYTLLIIVLFRIGAAFTVPFLDASVVGSMISSSGSLLGFIDVLTGGSFSRATVFALSISPYITASIVIQLLTIAIPALERLSKEGEEGRKKLNSITRYSTIGLALIQAIAYYLILKRSGAVSYTIGFEGFLAGATIVLTFTAGAMLVMWLGERIDEKGIGNGISIILFAGIVSRGPSAVINLFRYFVAGLNGTPKYIVFVPIVVIIFLVMITAIVIMTNAERRIPVQYAKRVVGRKMYGGQSSHIPVKVTMSGVMPIIFASSIISIPGTIGDFLSLKEGTFWFKFFALFKYTSWFYAVLYFILIIAFNYFYVAIQYNPMEMANNLQKNNGTIPGIRPGKATAQFISKVISKITLIGALFLAVIAILPIGIGAVAGMNIALGGTSIIIVVGVALDTTRELESQMMMRHYKGFLE
ncbi:MAG: preprotein translocase subunit SecY [Clostridia bacterium]|nr:preprotein translocase subunit SecY [Clostridia bacterium]